MTAFVAGQVLTAAELNALVATQVAVTAVSSNASYNLLIANSDTGALAVEAAANLVFNPSSGQLSTTLYCGTGGAAGAGYMNYLVPYSGGVSRTIASKLEEWVSVTDFGADPSGVVDSTAAFQDAINSVVASGGTVWVPAASFLGYKISSSLVIPSTQYYLRITGTGIASFISKSASFDLFTWSNPGGGGVAVPYTEIDNLGLNGNALTGSGSLIRTTHSSGLRLHDLFLQNLETSGAGILVEGSGGTYSHEVSIWNIYVSTSTGFAGILIGQTASDGFIDNFIMNGNQAAGAGCSYGLYISSSAGNYLVTNIHPYLCTINSLFMGAPASNTTWQVSDSYIDAGLVADNAVLSETSNAVFTNVTFRFAPSGYACLKLINATGNKFIGCTFDGGSAPATYAINETGGSNNNIFDLSTLQGSFSNNPSIVLVGDNSLWRVLGTDQIVTGYYPALTAGSTVYVGSGLGNSTEYRATFTAPYSGYIKKLILGSSAGISAGSVTGTVRIGSATPATTITAVLNSSLPYQVYGSAGVGIHVTEGQAVDVMLVSAGGSTTSDIAVTLVINY